MSTTLYCDDPKKIGCSWSGDRRELIARTENLSDRDFSYCPHCEGNSFTEEDEDES